MIYVKIRLLRVSFLGTPETQMVDLEQRAKLLLWHVTSLAEKSFRVKKKKKKSNFLLIWIR